MFFIVKVNIWRRPVLLTMKNIVKVAGGGRWLYLAHIFIPSASARWEISSNQEKNPCWLSV
ncbi:hypothetical protein [Paenibacillus eucommiae]|uniref:Uncharacterized protein n=1 Tax=Paenibacillus eucommiae TaxID=1355755 RepID=A0ABS4J3E4_9BACL|nr:hypothetical protein [Paenibacillus eucommiae]MBP1993805.1 hypothetical protein [Paenibacillus eucommiae]